MNTDRFHARDLRFHRDQLSLKLTMRATVIAMTHPGCWTRRELPAANIRQVSSGSCLPTPWNHSTLCPDSLRVGGKLASLIASGQVPTCQASETGARYA